MGFCGSPRFTPCSIGTFVMENVAFIADLDDVIVYWFLRRKVPIYVEYDGP